ncbi:MAG TPA: DUF2625 domain-containing protein [Candidatus Acidoferrum sp.]|nr:DUF2625 domain-containing protein [Candidatus Acidoferrum sp.]
MTARSLRETFAADEPAWPVLQSWINAAKNPVEILPTDEAQRRQVLLDMDVLPQSPMGAIVYHTGGLLVDHGWLRFVGSGSPRLTRTLPGWNRGRSSLSENSDSHDFNLVADDVVGGFFALNGGAFPGPKTEVFYFAPDTLRWEHLPGMGYAEFLNWSFNSNLDKFYGSFRWPGWQSEVSELSGDEAFSIYPPLFTKEGKNIADCSRRRCPVSEIYSLNVMEFPKQLNG